MCKDEGAVGVTHSPAYAEYAHRTVDLFDGFIVTENFNGNFMSDRHSTERRA
jgi:hypothetical protein